MWAHSVAENPNLSSNGMVVGITVIATEAIDDFLWIFSASITEDHNELMTIGALLIRISLPIELDQLFVGEG